MPGDDPRITSRTSNWARKIRVFGVWEKCVCLIWCVLSFGFGLLDVFIVLCNFLLGNNNFFFNVECVVSMVEGIVFESLMGFD